MASAAFGTAFRHLRDLFGAGSVVGLEDGQLLARYAGSKDEAAFEALVARHGPMVLATCRAILKNEHDVEDAFQATFLVLARKAGSIRAGDALGGWLHRVAYRAGSRRISRRSGGAEHEAEASAMASRVPVPISRPTWAHPARGDRPAARSSAAAGRALRPGGPDLRAGRRPAPLDRADAPPPAGQGPAAAQGPSDPPGRDRPGGRRVTGSARASAAVPAAWRGRRSLAATGGPASAVVARS